MLEKIIIITLVSIPALINIYILLSALKSNRDIKMLLNYHRSLETYVMQHIMDEALKKEDYVRANLCFKIIKENDKYFEKK